MCPAPCIISEPAVVEYGRITAPAEAGFRPTATGILPLRLSRQANSRPLRMKRPTRGCARVCLSACYGFIALVGLCHAGLPGEQSTILHRVIPRDTDGWMRLGWAELHEC